MSLNNSLKTVPKTSQFGISSLRTPFLCNFQHFSVSINSFYGNKDYKLAGNFKLCTGQFRNRPSPPPPPPGHLTFLKNFGQIPRYAASLDGQMLQPPGKTESLPFGNKFCKIFSHYEFLVKLVFAPRFKQTYSTI